MLAELVEREPEAKTNPSVQAAYVALDNMEAEELEAISAESALLWKEQQGLIREMARAKHASKLAGIKLAWHEAHPHETHPTNAAAPLATADSVRERQSPSPSP